MLAPAKHLPCNPIEHWQEHVEVARIVSVVSQMMPRRGRKPRRQPSAHVSAPVNLLKRDVVESKACKRPGYPAVLKCPLKTQEG